MFAKLAGGEKCSKINLKEAVAQVTLNDGSSILIVMNTHMGLPRYNRFTYGMASGLDIYQQLNEQTLKGSYCAAVFVDDIVVTGENDKDYLKNLCGVAQKENES